MIVKKYTIMNGLNDPTKDLLVKDRKGWERFSNRYYTKKCSSHLSILKILMHIPKLLAKEKPNLINYLISKNNQQRRVKKDLETNKYHILALH